ncbi:SDR family oxidoreductase [Fulvivirga sp. M361]|uniref:SDR family oxidoreductase n=1 Tax=Fulvivirga sp. M361 TaxID=2594266 RepID=UPI00117A8340|nr:SDR family oxidoreductase [Fulvivirga sp. M361]TRX51895.1 SDR family oxidoreductase [Fulvivirga sp. M361]
MDLKLKDKVFIVTGGAKGIGEAITLELVKEGAIPVIVGRSNGVAKQLAAGIRAGGNRCLVITIELGLEDVCKSIIDKTIAEFGQIDGIVNNAGTNDGVGLIEGSPEQFKNSVLANLTHYYDLVHYGMEHLKVTKGAIVNISSKTALTGQGGTSGYAASKGAQLALTREWAVELAPHGIRVNAVVPAEVMTPQYEKWINSFDDSERSLAEITKRIPLAKRMTTSEEIASMTLFLLSDRSSHTTGQWVFVDGGYVHLDRAIT